MVETTAEYPNLGLFCFGRGAFEKLAIRGDKTSAVKLYRARGGQFIYCKLFAFEGAFALVPRAMDGYFVSNEYPMFDVDTTLVLPEYLRIFITRPEVWNELASMTVGLGHRRQRLQIEDLLAYQVSLPSLDEQHRIVRLIQTLDVALGRATRLISDARVALDSIIETSLVERGAWNPKWTTSALGDLGSLRAGITMGRKTSGTVHGVPYMRAANVQDGYLDLSVMKEIEATPSEIARFALEPGDLLLLEGGNAEHVGRGWLWEGAVGECIHQNHVFRMRVDSSIVLPRFLAYVIGASVSRRHFLDSAKRTTNLATVNQTDVSDLVVPLPPIDEQTALAALFDPVRGLLVRAVEKLQVLEGCRAATVENLLSGRYLAPPSRGPILARVNRV
jgi:type I restriction enzyme, S subunit